ncbi:hypothetical protein H4Q26_005723, partial [Puccinia striiformis f. sp. tritici PST-130]
MEGTSPLNNSNNATNVPDQVPGRTLTSRNPDNSVSAQQQQNAPDDSANHTSRIFTLEEQTRIDWEYQALDRILGLTPGAETRINQDTLMATDMTPATNTLPPNPSIANRSIRQGSVASSQQSTKVSRQQTRTRNATQIENFVDEGEVQALLGLFKDQWSMWSRALKYESPAQARGALNQAAITRNMIRAMRLEEETDELCQYWNPISVLAEMDQEETTTGITDNDHVTVMPHTSTPTRHQSVPGAWPTSADRTTRVAPTSTTPSFYDSRSYGPASSAKPVPPPLPGGHQPYQYQRAAPHQQQQAHQQAHQFQQPHEQQPTLNFHQFQHHPVPLPAQDFNQFRHHPAPQPAQDFHQFHNQAPFHQNQARPNHPPQQGWPPSRRPHVDPLTRNFMMRMEGVEAAYSKGEGQIPEPSIKPSMNDTDPFDDILFDFDDLSNPSNKEFLLNNINNDFAREAPFLIEDRLKDFFSTFLSDLSGTIETIPGTLLETSIRNFNGEIMREAMKAMITTDVIPSMLDSVLSRIRGGPCENELPDLHVELRQFESLMSERVSTIQDSIYEINNNTTASLESLTKRIMDMEAESSHRSRYTNEKLSDMADQEDARNERVNRKLNDLASTINNLNYKFSQLIDPTPSVGRDTSPHIADRTHSNHLSSVVSAAPRVIQPTVQNRPTLPAPAENDEFPPLNHGPIDLDVKKELWRGIPRSSDWEVFKGEMPYNYELWIEQIDVYAADYLITDAMIVNRLTACLAKTAKTWYLTARVGNSNRTWAWWKDRIRQKFGTHHWKLTMRSDFESDKLQLTNPKVLDWVNLQRERLRAFDPHLADKLVCSKILDQCPRQLIHAIKSRYKKEDHQMVYEELVIIAEDILSNHSAQLRTGQQHQSWRPTWRDNNQFKRTADPKPEPEAKKPPAAAPTPPYTKASSIVEPNDDQEESNEDPHEENEPDDNASYDREADINPESFIGVIENGNGAYHDLDLPILAIECDICPTLSIAEVQAATH